MTSAKSALSTWESYKLEMYFEQTHSKKSLTAMIVPFYLGEKPDIEGRKIQQMWAWDFETLEITHDYIQWLFPIPEKSHFNPNAPIVDDNVIQCFRENPRLGANLKRSLTVILAFYGLTLDRDQSNKIIIEKAGNYSLRKQEWVNLLDHNYLRITRILKCLTTFGLQQEAQAFYACLRQIYQEDSDQIGAETLQYWTDAIN